ncbi:unnamed protein product [Sympodiomycopsis kandeliae]
MATVMSKGNPGPSRVKGETQVVTLAEAESAADANGGRRKRTRPVSACEACRAHKVRCILKPDQPVCERCSSSGKQCLFRIDDLRPDFRAERFAHLGPPGEGAREIKSRPKERRQSSSRDVTARQRKASSASQGEPDEIEEEAEEAEVEFASANPKKQKVRQDSAGNSGNSDDQSNGSKTKTKPIFRSFANPTNLAAPAPMSSPPIVGGLAATDHGLHRAPPPPGYAYPQTVAHHATSAPLSSSSNGTYPSVDPTMAQPPYPGHTAHGSVPTYAQSQSQPLYQMPLQQQQYPYHHPQSQQQHYAYSPPSAPSRAPNRYAEGSQSHIPYGSSSFPPPHAGPSASPSDAPSASSSSITAARNGMPPPPAPAYSPYRGHSHHASIGERSSSVASAGSPGDRIGLPPIRMAFPALREETAERSSGSRLIDVERYSNASESRSERPFSPIQSPAAPTPYSGHNGYAKVRFNGHTPANGDVALASASADGADRTGDGAHGEGQQGYSGSQGSKGSSGKKTSLVVPFFRWFGMTANTPGYRRIKVAVNPDLPTDEDSIQPGDQDEGTEAKEGEDREHSNLTAANLSGVAGKIGNTGGDAAGTAASPAEATAGDGSKHVQTTPKMNASDTSRSRPPSNSHRPFTALEHDSIASSSTRDLFDPSRPRYPRRDVLIHLSELFVKHFRTNLCPWVREDELLKGARDASLPSILANSICAMTARFSDWAELKRKTPKMAGEPFSEMAKTLIVPMLSWPSLDVIEALILLSYAEFGSGSDSGLWMYSGMGMRMAMDLGIQHESTIQSLPTMAEQEKARWLFWSGCYSIDRITCFGTGRPVTMMEHAIDCLPPVVSPESDVFYASQIVQILLRRGRMGELLNRRDDAMKMSDKKTKLSEMWQECAAYFQGLPSSCAFSVQSFKRAASQNRGAAFLFLHVLFQSTISLLERPGLMRGREFDAINFATPGVMHISASASRSIVDMINLANQVDPKSFHASPYLDQLILPTGRAFMQEREAIKEAMRQCGYRPGQSRQSSPTRGAGRGIDERLNQLLQMRKSISDSLANCTTWLAGLAHYWGGASWPARALEQEVAGEANVVPDVRDDDAMQAPLRDMELLSSWAKAKMKQAKGRMASRRGSAQGPSGPFAMSQHSNAGATGGEGRMLGMSSPATASNIANLLAAANAASHHDPGTTASDGSVMSSDGNPLGLALSGQLATSAEIDIHALVDAWAAEQVKTHPPPPSHLTDQSQHGQSNGNGAHRPWMETSGTPLPVANTPSGSGPMSFAALSSMNNFPSMDFSALQLEELLSTELGMGSGDDVFPLELPVDEFPGHSQQSISSALFGFGR